MPERRWPASWSARWAKGASSQPERPATGPSRSTEIPAASYAVTIDPESLPAGYPLDELASQQIAAEPDAAVERVFVLRAYRSVAGVIRLFDRATGRYTLLPRTLVEIPALHVRTTSDESGSYIL